MPVGKAEFLLYGLSVPGPSCPARCLHRSPPTRQGRVFFFFLCIDLITFGYVLCMTIRIQKSSIKNGAFKAFWPQVLRHPRATKGADGNDTPYVMTRDYSRGGQRCGPVVTVETIQRLSGAKEGVMPALEKLFEEVTS
eukprot:1193330-Prorocentrum_minimum.AAC.1